MVCIYAFEMERNNMVKSSEDYCGDLLLPNAAIGTPQRWFAVKFCTTV